MSLEDDQIRSALSSESQPYTAHSALREIRPSMQRARWRHKFASRATGVVLLVGAGAGVAALTNGPQQPATPAVSSDATLPSAATTISPPSTDRASTSEVTSALTDDAAVPLAPTAPPSAPPDEVSEADDSVIGPAADPQTGAAPVAPTAPPAPVPPVAPAPTPTPSATSQTITTSCGDVVLTIDTGTVRILSISPLPDYVERVSDDGPTTIEIRFSAGTDDSCEVHAELKPLGLDVEVQNPG